MQRDARSTTLAVLAGAIVSAAAAVVSAPAQAAPAPVKFAMVRNPGLADFPACAPNAHATVSVKPGSQAETMTVNVSGLPANTEFDFFVIQVPKAPFGMAWYQGDIETDQWGNGTAKFVGRFNEETFIVAPGVAPAPATHASDATSNPITLPVHTYHLGLWFNSPADAAKAGCPAGVTPFNGDHDAGVQVLNTSNFADLTGPLLKIKS